MQLRDHGESDFSGVTDKLCALHSPSLTTLRKDFNGCMILFWSHGVPEGWKAQVPIDIVGIRIDFEVFPCLNK